MCSEDDEDEEEVEPEKPAAEGEEAEAASDAEPPRKKRKNETFDLVEYSQDELRAVDKEMLNAEIVQLEGMSSLNPKLTM